MCLLVVVVEGVGVAVVGAVGGGVGVWEGDDGGAVGGGGGADDG